ncbi:nicotinate-nucleotide adenylyltransferase [Desmospora sp. 8437]|nr:nicotinate-nucleotide adenylyltransferase [Desmospora sp. 8437]
MAMYQARISWMKDHPPMNYLRQGDQLQVRGQTYTVQLVYKWKDRLVYETDRGILYADELVRIPGEEVVV